MIKRLESFLHKEMTRKEFLQAIGLGIISIFGFATFLRLLESKTFAQAGGENIATYGGGRPGHHRRKLLIKNGHLLTMDSQLGEIKSGDILVDNGKIAKVGHNLRHSWGTEVIDARNMIVMPGMVDNHRHLWVGLFRAYSGDHGFWEYIEEVHSVLSPNLTPQDMYWGGLLATLEALNSGTTTVMDWNHGCNTPEHAFAAVEALKESGARTMFAYSTPAKDQIVVDAGPTQAEMRSVYNATKHHELVDFAVATRSPRVISGEAGLNRIEQDVTFARELGVPTTMHFGFDTSENLASIASRGVPGPDFTLVHANQLTVDDFKIMADAGGWISSSPEVEMQMGFGAAPLRRMLDAGVKPTLSVDILTLNPGELFTQMMMILQTQRMLDQEAAGGPQAELLPVANVLPYATSNAAGSMGLGDKIGSLTPGKQADIIMLDGNDLNMALYADAPSAAVLMAHPGVVDTVMVGGKLVKRHKRLLYHDIDKVRRKAQKASKRLLQG